MKTTKLMPRAVLITRSHEAELFRVACLYNHKNYTIRQMCEEYKLWTSLESPEDGEWSFLNDFAIDVLANRVPVYVHVTGEVGETIHSWIIRPMTVLRRSEQWKKGSPEDSQWYDSF